MPKPAEAGHRYIPGLDGLRAIAVLAVIAFHVNIGWAQGGLLGVGVFFTLSGYLITDLLLQRWSSSGGLGLSDFWMRRARRLLPALVVMLAVVIAWVALFHRSQLPDLRGNVVAASVYMSNWWLILHHVSYFAQFGAPSPLGHLWSLAVEEQFYLLWPFILWLGLRAWPEPKRGSDRRPGLAMATLLLAAGSAVAMALLYHPGFNPNRVYDGTDTRAFALLIGAALAAVWPSRRRRVGDHPGVGRALDLVGLAGLVGIGLLVWRTNEYSAFLYRGGMVVLSVATALVVLAVVHPGSWLGRALGIRPLRWVGVRSYGIYLWHFPIIVLTAGALRGRFDLPRASVQVAATVLLAALSWRFIEEPILRGGRLPTFSPATWYRRIVSRWTWVTSTAALAFLAVTALVLGGVVSTTTNPSFASGVSGVSGVSGPTGGTGATGATTLIGSPAGSPTTLGSTESPAEVKASAARILRNDGGVQPGAGADPAPAVPSTTGAAPGSATTSSCRSVVHIGDSTSESLVSSDYLPNPSDRLGAQYARVGVANQYLEIEGGTSIVETISGEPNAYNLAKTLVAQGYHGCWVIALGTNDTADVYVGSNVSLAARIQRMMSVIGTQPVMWVNVRSLVATGPYSETDMERWDQALAQACPAYPNMRVYDWASVVQPSWFISDGIHYSTPGSAERARLIASALAEAFPAAGQRGYSGCVFP
jgi:peptidoglycan/LPS O-acetylase OafA/YrhL